MHRFILGPVALPLRNAQSPGRGRQDKQVLIVQCDKLQQGRPRNSYCLNASFQVSYFAILQGLFDFILPRALSGRYYFYFTDVKTKPQRMYVNHWGLNRKLNSCYVQIRIIQITCKKGMALQRCEWFGEPQGLCSKEPVAMKTRAVTSPRPGETAGGRKLLIPRRRGSYREGHLRAIAFVWRLQGTQLIPQGGNQGNRWPAYTLPL